MKTVIILSLLCWSTIPATAQDSAMVKKPSPATRAHEQMPVRRGQGTAMAMPSPYYRSRMVPMPADTNRHQPRRDTLR